MQPIDGGHRYQADSRQALPADDTGGIRIPPGDHDSSWIPQEADCCFLQHRALLADTDDHFPLIVKEKHRAALRIVVAAHRHDHVLPDARAHLADIAQRLRVVHVPDQVHLAVRRSCPLRRAVLLFHVFRPGKELVALGNDVQIIGIAIDKRTVFKAHRHVVVHGVGVDHLAQIIPQFLLIRPVIAAICAHIAHLLRSIRAHRHGIQVALGALHSAGAVDKRLLGEQVQAARAALAQMLRGAHDDQRRHQHDNQQHNHQIGDQQLAAIRQIEESFHAQALPLNQEKRIAGVCGHVGYAQFLIP